MAYKHVKAWRKRNPNYHKNWMRKKRGSKLAVDVSITKQVDNYSDLISKLK